MFRIPENRPRVRVEYLLDDVQVLKEGTIVEHDARHDRYLVRTDWGVEWYDRDELDFYTGPE